MYGLSKKKMPYLYLVDEAIGLLNNEIRLVEWHIKYPEQFKSHFNKQPFSPVFLTPSPYGHSPYLICDEQSEKRKASL